MVLLPAEGAEPAARAAVPRSGRERGAALQVGLGVGFLVVAILLTFRELGLPFSDALTWPLVLVAAGGGLIWRQSGGRPGSARSAATRARAGATPAPRLRRCCSRTCRASRARPSSRGSGSA